MFLRRGFGHVEAVITLVIFIAFIVFAFTFFSPFRASRTLTSTLDYSWREVEDFTSNKVDYYSVVLSSISPASVSLLIPGIELNASVIDSSGNSIPSYNDQFGVNFAKPTDNFVVIRYSKHFRKGSSIIGVPLTANDYSISSSDTKSVSFESLFLKLNDTYYSNYTGLKKQFNLPNRVQFGFSVFFSDGSKIESYQNIPSGVEVISKNDRVLIIRNSTLKEEYAEVNVQVW